LLLVCIFAILKKSVFFCWLLRIILVITSCPFIVFVFVHFYYKLTVNVSQDLFPFALFLASIGALFGTFDRKFTEWMYKK
jgi:hypothetical protein